MKQKSRSIPYRVYKRLFSDCNAYDYCKGKITVDFPADYLESKMVCPDGWYEGANNISHNFGRTSYGYSVNGHIAWHTDGGCKFYEVYITIGNTFAGGSQKSKINIRSFSEALDWAISTAEELTA